mgnify:CR=1 FL=1
MSNEKLSVSKILLTLEPLLFALEGFPVSDRNPFDIALHPATDALPALLRTTLHDLTGAAVFFAVGTGKHFDTLAIKTVT